MENVKGLLSASTSAGRIFERITADLADPSRALASRNGHRYSLFPLSVQTGRVVGSPVDYLVRSERYGVPQRRHRLIIVGIREDLGVKELQPLAEAPLVSVSAAIDDLPKLRSGLSRGPDSLARWLEAIREARTAPWLKDLRVTDSDVHESIVEALDRLVHRGRGGEAVDCAPDPLALRRWYRADGGPMAFNHSTRGHIPQDLQRYLFAACFSQFHGRSPELSRFPNALLPCHKNAKLAVETGSMFSDRFRVQLRNAPSTTVTSHISKDGHYFIHHDPRQCRSLTVREAARLQTFPDSYFFCGPRTAQYTQVGNAVPPFLASRVASVLHSALRRAGAL